MNARLMLLVGSALLLFSAACSSVVTKAASNVIPRTLPARPTPAEVGPGTQRPEANGLPVGLEQAPICQASKTCAALDAEQIPLSCVKKVPYTNVLVPIGTEFDVVDASGEFVCLDTGVVVNGKEVITCHGRELYSFQLKLTNTACSGASLTTGTAKCDDGYGYDAEQECCAPVSGAAVGTTVVTVNLGACPTGNP